MDSHPRQTVASTRLVLERSLATSDPAEKDICAREALQLLIALDDQLTDGAGTGETEGDDEETGGRGATTTGRPAKPN